MGRVAGSREEDARDLRWCRMSGGEGFNGDLYGVLRWGGQLAYHDHTFFLPRGVDD